MQLHLTIVELIVKTRDSLSQILGKNSCRNPKLTLIYVEGKGFIEQIENSNRKKGLSYVC